MDNDRYVDKDWKIPIKIVIGVTGHRKLTDENLIRKQIKVVIKNVDTKFKGILKNSDYSFGVISPLAEGTDRIAVEEILNFNNSSYFENAFLEVILPLSQEDYLNDFSDVKSKDEFKNFLDSAQSVKYLDRTESREEAYYESGLYTVDNCDILIGVWNGKPAKGLGGTADVIKYARERKKWLFLINSENGIITEEGNAEEYFTHLDIYNKEKVSRSLISGLTENNYTSFIEKANEVGLPINFINKTLDNLLPQFIRADLLAQNYQKLYGIVGSSIYALSAGAVATVTIQILFFSHIPKLIWLEVAEISFILFLLIVSSLRDWHRKWIDYRFLAERLRTALFFRVANIKCEISRPPPHLRLTNSANDWIIRAFNSIWKDHPTNDEIPFQSFKNFLLEAWIDDQIHYYSKSAEKNRRNHKLFSRFGEIFFILTLVAASIHALEIDIFVSPQVLVATAIILPAIAAAITGIRNNRDYSRNAKRYKQMAEYTSNIRERIKKIDDMETLVETLDKVNKMMLGEHQDWRVVVQFHKLHPP